MYVRHLGVLPLRVTTVQSKPALLPSHTLALAPPPKSSQLPRTFIRRFPRHRITPDETLDVAQAPLQSPRALPRETVASLALASCVGGRWERHEAAS